MADFAILLLLLYVLAALVASGHALLNKRDPRAAAGWVGMIWLTPFLGVLLYLWLGINRIERRAQSLRANRPIPQSALDNHESSTVFLDSAMTVLGSHLRPLTNLVGDVTRRPLLPGNHVVPLMNGDQAYPAMLRAIEEATQSITLTTYIFRHDSVGQQFLEALQRAVSRQILVRVLIDDVGSRYSWRPMPRKLQQAGIPCARFLPTLIPWRFRYSNLRCHRKILVVDGKLGFAGGMNLDERTCLECPSRHPIQDLHFQLTGPVVTQLQKVFLEDWAFTTGELLGGKAWFSAPKPDGPTLARGIPGGPDDDFESMRLTLLGALACARSSVCVVTPYFLPDVSLIAALNVAALRGVEVNLILPAENDLALVQWASTGLFSQLLERGCRIWLTPPPFDHTKLMLVDEHWTLFGSANWDPRSLRLNFEFNVECYDSKLAILLTDLVRSKMQKAHRLSLDDVNGRSLLIKLRDAVAGLFSPYL